MTRGPGSTGRAPLLVAGVAAGSGLLAVVTGAGSLAVLAGVASVIAAVLVARAAGPWTVDLVPEDAATPSSDEAAGDAEPSSGGPIPLPAASEPPPRSPPPQPGPFVAAGMLGEEFFRTTLHSRVAVARRALRPLSLVYFEVLELGEPAGKRPLDRDVVAESLRQTLREADTAGVVAGGSYACILEDTGPDGAVWTAERIRRNLADADPGRRFRAGVASYPNHGLDVTELQAKVGDALDAARDWSRDRIEVATGGS